MTKMRLAPATVALVFISLVAAGCGGGGSNSSSSTTSTNPTGTTVDAAATTTTALVTPAGDLAAVTAIASALQTDLLNLGVYTGPIDGQYNAATVDALKAAQTKLGVAADGVYGPKTDAALQAGLTKAGKGPGTVVTNLQTALTQLSFYTGPIDGQYSAATTDAIKAMQLKVGVAADGLFGPKTFQALVTSVS